MIRQERRRSGSSAPHTLPKQAYEPFSKAKLEPEGIARFEGWLLEAARLDNDAAARNLLDCGINPDARDKYLQTPLALAAANGSVAVGRMLIQKGADVNAIDDRGWSPIIWAASYGKTEFVEMLLEFGADKNSRGDQGETPLWAAETWGHSHTEALLRARGATAR